MNPKRTLARIDTQLAAIREMIVEHPELLDLRVASVSGWSIRQQIDHVAKVLALGLRTLAENPQRQPRSISLLGRTLMALDWLPRGVARSPRSVVPEESTNEALLAEVDRLSLAYRQVPPEDARFFDTTPVFPHPYFGGLSRAQGAAFLGTHTHHHWKIVRDIRKAAARERVI